MKKILIIEDEQDLASTLSKRLTSVGYEVMISMDALLGVVQAHKSKVDLIILDLMLPGGGGHSVLSNLKCSTLTMNIPVLVLTGMQDEVRKKKILEMGVDGYMQKPYEIQNVLSEIKRILVEP